MHIGSERNYISKSVFKQHGCTNNYNCRKCQQKTSKTTDVRSIDEAVISVSRINRA